MADFVSGDYVGTSRVRYSRTMDWGMVTATLSHLFLFCYVGFTFTGKNIFFSQIPSTYPILYGQLNKTNQKPLSDGTNLLDSGIFVVILCNIVPAHSKVHNTCRFRLLPVRRVCLAGSQHPRGIQRFHRRICKRTDGERYR